MKRKHNKNIKLCIVCSGGGHLTECLAICEDLSYARYFVTFSTGHEAETLKSERYYTILNPYRNIFRFVLNAIQSAAILLKERPDFVMSNGASVAISTILLAKFMRKKVIYVTPAAAVFTPCVTGKFVYPFCDLFIVSWRPLLKYFRKAVYVGDFLK